MKCIRYGAFVLGVLGALLVTISPSKASAQFAPCSSGAFYNYLTGERCSVTSSHSLVVSSMQIVGGSSVYAPGETIRFSVKGIVSNGTVGGPAMGFNVQYWLKDTDPTVTDTIKVNGVYQAGNAVYNPNTALWDVTAIAPANTSRVYSAEAAFYCSNSSAGCVSGQISKSFTFTVGTNRSSKPYIENVAGKAAGGFEVDSGGMATLTGTNLAGRMNSTHVYIAGREATIEQLGDTLIWFSVPEGLLLGAYYDLTVENDKGSSNTVRVKVISSGCSVNCGSPESNLSVTVLSPKGGESWKIGEKHTVTWKTKNAKNLGADIYLTHPLGGYCYLGTTGADKNTFTFTVPSRCDGVSAFERPQSDVVTSGSYRLLVNLQNGPAEPLVSDSSDGYISISSKASTLSITEFRISQPITSTIRSTTLVWNTTGANQCYLSGPNFGVNSALGVSAAISTGVLSSNSTYTLLCYSATGGSVSKTLTVSVPAASSSVSEIYDMLVTSPQNTNETWKVGDKKTIAWNYPSDIAGKKVILSVMLTNGSGISWPIYSASTLRVSSRIPSGGNVSWSGLGNDSGKIQSGRYFIQISAYDSETGITHKGNSGMMDVISSGKTEPEVTISGSLLQTSDDKAGTWNTFGPGAGNINKSSADWNWSLSFGTASSGKTIKRITLIHNTSGEVWSTGYSRYLSDGTDLFGYAENPYPLVAYRRSERDGRYLKLTTGYDQFDPTVGATIASRFGNDFTLYGQKESSTFTGGRLIVEFTDGTQAVTTL